MTAMTKHDAITAAMGVAEDVAQGRLDPAALAQQAVGELRDVFGTVVGPDDPAWGLQADVARQVIALGALTAEELSEWAAVMRRRAGEPISESDADETLSEPESFTSEEPTAEEGQSKSVAEPIAELETVPLPRRAGGYDPLAGWSPGRILG
ncbi:flagellar hook-length control protein [Mycobacterium sp. IDR2000157661]|uniref:flagellar hook-length control protein n=1 Tax=Mycobacterium sp. IDR2000157661 TaxID=2867005 RepID=UPI001EEBFC1F|nr:flagellar hook-length control protein [Mycobacterium sp. IDR2000157661]ULE33344.1 flagellar hook-length control protein [Mycobacterium sp. IDR2000157661]